MNRLLLFLENYKRESSGEVGCKFILDLPPPEASDVRLEVCRCMGVERHEAGTRICKQVRAADEPLMAVCQRFLGAAVVGAGGPR